MTVSVEPVWDGYCADPFVLRTESGWVMYGSTPGPLPDGRWFQTLQSTDLVTWTDVGGALRPLTGLPTGSEYWAPEVTEVDGAYWMYYSVGVEDVGHHLRVATSTTATGPFTDIGVDLTPDLPFAIDPSPFLDDDGRRWLFFATDVVEGDRPGTALAVAELTSLTTLGTARVLLTASADWQRYQAERPLYGGVHDWHTLEGPQVVARAGKYWMCYSGGNWHDPGYGVAVATASSPEGPWQPTGNHATFLSSALTGLVGPGHNSLFLGEGDQLWTAFHAWDGERRKRRPHLARVAWGEGGPYLPHVAAQRVLPDEPPLR